MLSIFTIVVYINHFFTISGLTPSAPSLDSISGATGLLVPMGPDHPSVEMVMRAVWWPQPAKLDYAHYVSPVRCASTYRLFFTGLERIRWMPALRC